MSIPTAAAERSDSTNEIAVLRSALANAQQRLDSLETKQATAPTQAAAAPSAAVPDPSDTIDPQNVHDRAVNKVAAMQERFATEPPDRSWASGAERHLRDSALMAAGNSSKFSITNLSCRTSICKMDISQASMSDQQAFVQKFPFNQELKDLAGMHFAAPEQRPDGTLAVVAYMFRRGYPMPGAEEPQ
jgi:hypothetical protein